MSGVAIVRYVLAHNTALTAIVPADSIYGGAVPIKSALPAIGVTSIIARSRNIVAMNNTKSLVTERVQVTAMAKSYAQVKALLVQVAQSLPYNRGTINGYLCDSIVSDIEGPDLYETDPVLYFQTADFQVKYIR